MYVILKTNLRLVYLIQTNIYLDLASKVHRGNKYMYLYVTIKS